MKNKFMILLVATLGFVATTPAAIAQDNLSLSLGYYDINDNEGAVDFRAEYRWDDPLFWVVKPWLGAEASSDGAIYALGGILIDVDLDEHWRLTPSFGAGLYSDGGGKDLGSVIEFRSQLEIGYEFDSGQRASVAGGHISNAHLNEKNPGTEILSFYYHLPINWF